MASIIEPAEQLGLHRRVFRGGSVLAAGTWSGRLARLGRNMILARLIAPDQFGTLAIVLAVVALFEALLEVGISQAVIQSERGSAQAFLNVAWWLSGLRGLVLFGLGAALAPVAAMVYDDPDLTMLLRVAFLTMVFNGFTSPKIFALQRQFRFGANVIVIQGAGLLGTAATIVMGIYWQNVWALVWGTVLEACARCVLSFAICPIRPRLKLDREALRELWAFSLGMAGLSLLTYLIMNADVITLGWVVSASELGLYSLAIALAQFPLMIFSKVIQPLNVPLLATHQKDMPRLRTTFLAITRLVWLFGLPMATCLAVFSEPLLTLVYGRPDFSQVAPAFSIYSFFVVAYMAGMVSFSVYIAIARPAIQRRFTVIRALVVVISLYPLSVLLGGTGAALALLVSLLVAMVAQLFNLRRTIELPITAYVRSIWPGLLAATAALALSLTIRYVLDLPDWAQVVGAVLIGGLVWGPLIVAERRGLKRLRAAPSAESPAAG